MQPFYLIIAGSRDYHNYEMVEQRTTEFLNAISLRWIGRPVVVVCGMARGADTLGHAWARNEGLGVVEMPADWDKYGRGAGYRRNDEMVRAADAAIYFWDGKSRGTAHCISSADHKGIPYAVVVGHAMNLHNIPHKEQFEPYEAVEL